MKDNQFRNANTNVHPYAEPYLVFNDKKGCPTIYFQSKYNDIEFCKKHWGVSPYELHKVNPILYHWPEKKENELIIIERGGHGRIPHGFYIVNTRDGSPATFTVRSENEL